MNTFMAGVNQESAVRSVWRYQPLVPVAVAFAVGVTLDRYDPLRVAVWLPLAFGTLFLWAVAIVLRGRSPNADDFGAWNWLSSILLLLAVLAVGGTWHHLYWHVYPADDIGHWCDRKSQPARLRGVLAEEPLIVPGGPSNPLRVMPERDRSVCQIAVRMIEGTSGWVRASGRAHLTIDGKLAVLHAGDAVEVLGELTTPAQASNPGEFDYANYLRGRRTRALVRCDGPHEVTRCELPFGSGIGGWLERIAGACERRLMERLPPGRREIAVALLLGRYELLEEEVTERYMRTGTMHILAISGQHLAILAGFLWLVLRLVPIPRKWGAVVLGLIVVGYALLTGARPPVLRAAVLVCVLIGAIVLDVRSRRANPLALALIIVLGINPSDLFDRGLQLSFLAVGALSWIVRPVWLWLRREPDPIDQLVAETRPRWLQTTFAVGRVVVFAFVMSGVVWLANVPLLAARFHLFSPIVVLLTVAMTPLATMALIAGLGLLVVDPWAPVLGSALAKVCDWGIGGMDWCVQVGAELPGGYWYVPGPPDWWVIGFYLGVLGILLFRPEGAVRWRWAATGVAWLALGFAVPALRPAPDRLECQILSVGNGSAAVLRLPGGKTVLVDAGTITGPRVGSRQIAPALWSTGITHIDAVFISHADVDHFNGLPHLAERFSIGEVFVPPHFAGADQEAVKLVCGELERRGVPIRVSFADDRFDFGRGVVARVLHPPTEFGGTDNEQSLVLLLEYCGRRILLPGDLEGAGLRRLIADEPLPVDVLVAPHHGSRRANPPELAEWTRPQLVVVSQGKPRSGATLEIYRQLNIPVLTTNEYGAITIRADKSGLDVQTILHP